MQPESARPTGVRTRSRTTLAAATAVLLLVLTGAWASTARAIPPGGAVENRAGASIAVTGDVVKPVTAGDPASGIVAFTGSGFASGEVLLVKIDDGAIAPDKTTRPTPPPNVTPQSDDWVAIAVATGSGTISGSVDLRNVADADDAKVSTGKHLLRFVSSQPRSIHADFAVKSTLPASDPGLAKGAKVALGPPADLPLSWSATQPFEDIPKFVTGSKVPFRVTGFSPNQTVSVRIDNGAVVAATPQPDPTNPGGTLPTGVWDRFITDTSGAASGYLNVPTDSSFPGVHWVRFLASPTSIGGDNRSLHATYEVDSTAAARTVGVAASGQRGRSVTLTGSGLLKEAFYLNGGAGNTGDGQTVTARIDGTGVPFSVRANNDGSLAGELPIPSDTALGTHKVVLYVGFRANSDFPQTVQERTFEVTEFVPDPVVVTPPGTTTLPPATSNPVVPPPAAAPVVPATPAVPSAPTASRAATISSSALRATKRGRVALSLVRPSATTKVAVSVRSKARIRVAGRRAKKLVTLVQAKTVTLKAGTAKQRIALSLPLTKEGRAALKRAKTLKVVVRVAPASKGAKAITKTVNLRG